MTVTWRVLLVLGLLTGLVACDDDDCPSCPDRDVTPSLTELEDAWPNDDGRAWSFALESRWSSGEWLADDQGLTIDDVDSVLATFDDADSVSNEGDFRLVFEDSVTTELGLRKQFLNEYYLPLDDIFRRPIALPSWSERLALRRRAALLDHVTTGPLTLSSFVLGGYWEKTDDAIVMYGDVSLEPTWRVLEANLDPGHEFSFELVFSTPEDPQTMTVRVVREVAVDTGWRRFERGLEVHYLLDLGIFQNVDESGDPLGPPFRSIDIGAVVYVAGVGPVRSRERRYIAPTSGVLEGSPPALFHVEMNLIGTGTIGRR